MADKKEITRLRRVIEKLRTEQGETHEPEEPADWPHGHVGVELTDSDEPECIVVTIHGQRHFLHSTTAMELRKMLDTKLEEWNAIAHAHGAPGV